MNSLTVMDYFARMSALLIVVLGLSVAGVSNSAVPAGVDMVFMIDQSGSMMGKGASAGVRNDPHGKRIDAVKQLEEQLVQSAQAGYVNRISVVEFGGRNARSPTFRPQLTLSRLALPALIPGQDTEALRDRIRDGLALVQPRFRGDTDIARAMSLAQAELDACAAQPPSLEPGAKAGDRRRIVVLITDGAPYAEGVSDATIRAEIEQWAGQLQQDAGLFTFMVYGLNDGSSNYWQTEWGEFWRRLASADSQDGEGLAFLLAGAEEAGKKINAVLSEYIPPGASTGGSTDTYTVPAYLKALSFIVDFDVPHLPDSVIDVRGPDGTPLPLAERQPGFATIRLNHPEPGQYRLRSADAPYRVRPLPVYETVALESPASSVPQSTDLAIAYRLGGRGAGGLFEPQPNLPAVRFELVIDDPDGSTRRVPMQYDQATGNVVAAQPQRLERVGVYALSFTGTTKGQDGTDNIVYRRDDPLVVDATTPIHAYFISPSTDSAVELSHGYAEVPVRLRFRHAYTGTDIPTSVVLAPSAVPTVGYAIPGSDPEQVTATAISLADDGAELAAVLPIDFGRTRWDLLRSSEPLRLVFGANPDAWRNDIRYVGVAGTGDYWFGPEVTVSESPWVLWVWGLLLLASLLLLLALLALLWRLVMVPWLIRNNDRKYNLEPVLSFRPSRRPDLIENWPLKALEKGTGTTFVRLSNGDGWSVEQFRIRRLRRTGKQVAVQVQYRPYGTKKGRVREVLEARDDLGQPKSRCTVQGLPNDLGAEFLLLAGRSDQ